ncbi:unnamed protein product [Laminaria digitata]
MSRVVCITGASSGFGSALASLYAGNGDAVALLARRKDRIDGLAAQLRAEGRKAMAISCDVTDRAVVHDAIRQCESEFGPVDLMIANAGVAMRTKATGFDAEVVRKTFEVNLFGVAHCLEAVLPGMIARNSGQLVGISSLAGYRGVPGAVAYCSSKAALNNMLESLRVELHKTNIDVTTICPGYVKTEMTSEVETPMPFLLELDDAARRIYRAIDRSRSEFAFPWPLAFLTSFGRLVPNAIYDRLASYFSI